MLEILPLVLGPVSTNVYLVADNESGQAAVIDPAWDGRQILDAARTRSWEIRQFWYTHAHFDHFAGADELSALLPEPPRVALHPADRSWLQNGGGGEAFGYRVNPGPEPTIDLAEIHLLGLGSLRFEVRHTPGHSPGSCIFYCRAATVAFTGDLIFLQNVGRTDLPGGQRELLFDSIRRSVFSLPEETLLRPGHGPPTTVGTEKRSNPWIKE